MQLVLPFKQLSLAQTQWHLDMRLLLPVLALLSIGLIMVASASFSFAEHRLGDQLFFFKRHLAYLLIAAGAMAVGFFVSPSVWANYGRLWILLAVFLLIIVLIPGIGREVNGSRRWLAFAGFTLQVSELVKVATVVFLAAHLEKHRDTLSDDWREFFKLIAVIVVLSILLLMEPDFGSAVTLSCTFMALLFLGGSHIRQFSLVFAAGLLAIGALAYTAPYRLERLATYLDPWADPFNAGYQLIQSLIAFGRGEWFGVGLGQSVQKMLYLPEAHTDFVFAIFAEEFGFVGVLCLMSLYVLLILRVLQLGKLAIGRKNWYAAFVLIGFGLLLSGQTFINLGVNAGLLPTKGLTLPFVSYGGSSLLVCCAMIGMMLRFAHEFQSPAAAVRRPRYGK
ncbi:MAG: putative lipid II flippase FtsW [Porticoccaceae bacterium]|jgi:cell division protein FtsW|nr:putative lipid II flippase FtsW [Porticoccaceae bacterium]MBT6320097.1 putative lipid II flippase FtsW [Porticoccaceae bacterium]MBT7259473.1 putative lipid II flippase FtsW [Porticoccaceae bacterium]MBT7904719.1 putative lipid II flippase FtsW [Porticoccaceae bacterium]MDA8936276.1 putative lipid II flippase FtsW [Porticoccaceae bacterium]